MGERDWQLSADAQTNELYLNTIDAIKPFVDRGDELIIHDPETQYFFDHEQTTESKNASRFEQFLKTAFFEELTDYEKAMAVRGFLTDSEWGYGIREVHDGLIDGERADVVVEANQIDSLIVSGLAGSELIGKSRELDDLSERLSKDMLRRAVLLGGLGLIAAQGRWSDRLEGMAKYTHRIDESFSQITAVGATVHGDFQINRRTVFNGDVTDPLGRKLPFGPALPEAVLGAYHSVEPDILAAVIKHAALRGHDPRVLRQTVLNRWEALGSRPSFMGNFGDFGDDDGRLSAANLRHWLEQSYETDESVVLSRLVVWPGDSSVVFTSESQTDGLHFSWERGAENEYLDQYERLIVIGNDELADFMVALLEQARRGAGRTSVPALKTVLDAIE